jgi:hypothetical protein
LQAELRSPSIERILNPFNPILHRTSNENDLLGVRIQIGDGAYGDFGRDQFAFSLSCGYQIAASPSCNQRTESA